MPAGIPIPVSLHLGTHLDNPVQHAEPGLTSLSLNALSRDGELITRPGLALQGNLLNEKVLGLNSIRNITNNNPVLLAATTKRWWKYDIPTATWLDISGGVLLTQTLAPTVFNYFYQGAVGYAIGVNDLDPTKEYDPAQAAYASVANAPVARCVCTVANRLIYGNVTVGANPRNPHGVVWSAAGDRTSYPALATNTLAETKGVIMAGRTLGRRSGAIYKEDSQWLAVSQPGSDAEAFEFVLLERLPGPVGPAAIDDGPGGMQHVYLASDGNIYSFNGVSGSIVAETQKYVQDTVGDHIPFLSTLAYFPQKQEIWAILPHVDGSPSHLLIYSYKTQKVYVGIATTGFDISALGMLNKPETISGFTQNPSVQKLLFAGTTNGVFSLTGTADQFQNLSNDWRIMLPVTPGQEYEFDGIEAQFENTPAVVVTVSVFIGQTYDNLTERVLGTLDVVNNETRVNVQEGSLRGRIVIIRFQADGYMRLRNLEVYAWLKKVSV